MPRLQLLHEFTVVVLARGKFCLVLMIENEILNAGLLRVFEARDVRPIRDHHGKLGIQLLRRDCLDDGLEVAAPPRDQHADAA